MSVRIETLDDVLPHISYDNGIVVSQRGEYTVVDYVFVTKKTFGNQVARECRGLKFSANGQILARPFHKFFNIGEKETPEAIDWSQAHVVMDKLDGSMIHPCLLGDRMTFMTRMGETDHAKAALKVASNAVKALSHDLIKAGTTPIFEFTSPANRVVITYQKTALTLLAARDTITGIYHSHAELVALATSYGVPVVAAFGSVEDPLEFVRSGRLLEGVEGYVVAFDNGHRLKLKADAYVLRHKALSGVTYEKNLLAWIVDDALDDVLAILHDDIADRVRSYHVNVMEGIAARLAEIETFMAQHGDSPRRDVAIAAQQNVDKRLQSVVFAILDGHDGREALIKILRWASHSEGRVDTVRDLFGINWSGSDLAIRDI